MARTRSHQVRLGASPNSGPVSPSPPAASPARNVASFMELEQAIQSFLAKPPDGDEGLMQAKKLLQTSLAYIKNQVHREDNTAKPVETTRTRTPSPAVSSHNASPTTADSNAQASLRSRPSDLPHPSPSVPTLTLEEPETGNSNVATDSLSPQATSRTCQPHPEETIQTTYRDILIRNNVPESQHRNAAKAIALLKPNQRERTGQPRLYPTRNQALQNKSVQPVYVLLRRQALGETRKSMSALGIDCSHIHNVHFIGSSVCELLVSSTQKDSISDCLKRFGFKTLQDYDPAKPRNTSISASVADSIKQRFKLRMQGLLKHRFTLMDQADCQDFEQDPVTKFVMDKLKKANIAINLPSLLAAAHKAARSE